MYIKNNNKKIFEEKLACLNKEIGVLKTNSSVLSTVRGLFFLGAVLIVASISNKGWMAFALGICLFFIFLAIVKFHEVVEDKLIGARSKKEVVSRYIMRFDDNYKNLSDDGSEYLLAEDTVARDIDLLGKASLFQLINVCHTKRAKEKLAESLKANAYADNVFKINEAVMELMKDIDCAIEFEALGIKTEQNKKNKGGKLFFDFCNTEVIKLPAVLYAISVFLPLAEILLIVLFMAGVLGYGYAIAGFFVLLIFAGLTKGITDIFTAPMLNASVITREYIGMLKLIADMEYNSEYLKDMQIKTNGKTGAITAFKKLSTISEAYKLSFNPLLYTVLNGILLWDYRLAKLTLRWKEKYGESAALCEDIISDMEYMRSLAVVGIVRDTSFADLKAKKDIGISFENIYHPLITQEKVVENSADISSGITIITGSNMSGKTTFLRTISINLVLAYIGAPVCADRLSASYMKIFSSMRVMDDVTNGISTFYAEILRIKAMAEYRNEGKPMLCMIDEIFKGTNSADRIVGATEAIKRLSGKNSITMVSTHDFELCEIADNSGEIAKNYHFEEYYENEKLMFDYKLKSGKCNTTNARAILKMAGFDI